MNTLIRFLFQILLWLTVWIILWYGQGWNIHFLYESVIAFAFQILLIAGLIFYITKAILFKKKYVLFLVVSIVMISVFSYISSNIFTPPKIPPFEELKNLPRKPPSHFFIYFLLLSTSYILAVFLETFLFAQKKEEEIIINKNEALLTELKLLKSQINPHFLFNSLNNIYALSVIDSDKTQQSISYLSNMLRYVLYDCEQPLVSLPMEIKYIENYIKLFSIKSNKKYPISTDFNILNSDISIAPMLFIPFVENALKHGHIEKIKESYINIQIYADPNQVKFEIINSIPQKTINKDSIGGIGLENVKKRLAILYTNKHQLTIDKNSEAFKVKLNIQLN